MQKDIIRWCKFFQGLILTKFYQKQRATQALIFLIACARRVSDISMVFLTHKICGVPPENVINVLVKREENSKMRGVPVVSKIFPQTGELAFGKPIKFT